MKQHVDRMAVAGTGRRRRQGGDPTALVLTAAMLAGGVLAGGVPVQPARAQAAGSTPLRIDTPLRAGQEIRSPDGQTRLIMQEDCNLVLYGPRGAVFWSSRTDGRGAGCYAIFQGDGNLVVYTGADAPVWASSTEGRGARDAQVSNAGTVSVSAGGRVLWSSPRPPGYQAGSGPVLPDRPSASPSRSELRAGQTLAQDEQLASPGGRFTLAMQADCNLVLYRDGRTPVWASQTANRGQGCRADMQSDGNFVVYDRFNRPLWSSGTAQSGATRLQLDPRGAFTLLGGTGGRPIWSSDGEASSPGGGWDSGSDSWNRPVGRPGGDNLVAGDRLRAGREGLVSDNGRYELRVRGDCEVGLLEGSRVVWTLGMAGRGRNCEFGLGRDGDLALVDERGSRIWSSRTSGARPDRLAVTDDGRVILLRRWTEVWASSRAR